MSFFLLPARTTIKICLKCPCVPVWLPNKIFLMLGHCNLFSSNLRILSISVSGGHNGVTYLRRAERFDPVCSEWTILASLDSPRTGLGLTVVNNLIYVIGGHDGSRYLNKVQRYDPRRNIWATVKDMHNPRCYMAVVAIWLPH